ncbi:MAG: SGNH/GDSL hydrolase family protein [Clostridia bacterium]|nr:SGNH/GDSL hydrolase family protein [Clostridia bacterium]
MEKRINVVFADKILKTECKIPLVAGDKNTYVLSMDTNKYPDAARVFIYAKKADGEVVYDSIPAMNGNMEYILKNGMYSVPGTLELRVILKGKADESLTASIVNVDVIEGIFSEETAKNVGSLEELLTVISQKMDRETERNTYNTLHIYPEWKDGYIATNGFYDPTGAAYKCCTFEVKGGDRIAFVRASGYKGDTYRFATFYKDEIAIENLGLEYTQSFVVPEGADKCSISLEKASTEWSEGAWIERITTANNSVMVETLAKQNKTCDSVIERFDLAANKKHYISRNAQNMCGYTITFRAKLEDFSGLKIVKGAEYINLGGIEIDDTNVYLYINNTENKRETKPHGLTFKDYIYVELRVDHRPNATVNGVVATNGGWFSFEFTQFLGFHGDVYVKTQDALTDCIFTYRCKALNEPIWLYGDSYFKYVSDTRWTYYLANKGKGKHMLNGFDGRNSQQALEALKTDLSYGAVPKKVVWCMGMNDGDDGAVNERWMTCLEEVISICKENDIELYLATVPNVPSVDNSFKNDYVVNSGYKYIDFARAVGAYDGNAWYEGMLSTDNVHPDARGAIALYSEAVSKLPELLD